MGLREQALRTFSYDPETGALTRKMATSNRVKVGEEAGTLDGKGYRQVNFMGKLWRSHRLIWFIVTGEIPKCGIDHKDGDGLNNRWSNLRLATQKQNTFNTSLRKDSSTGIRGVSRMKRDGTYRVYVQGKHYGYFKDLELAELVAKEVRMTLFGEFYRG